MTDDLPSSSPTLAAWHRGLLIAAMVASTMLIAMGGILCVTHFIRTCPDWPGCFGRLVPPVQTGAILEYTHRLLAAISGILILSVAITGLVRKPRERWTVILPWISVLLLIEVSYFGAQVVLRGLAPGWAAVDVGSALLVVAFMVTSAVIALDLYQRPGGVVRLSYPGKIGKLALAATAVVYLVLVSGVLVAGNNSITGCLGWPVYSSSLFKADLHQAVNLIRWTLSLIGILLVISVLVYARRMRTKSDPVYRLAVWAAILFVLEALIQAALLVFDLSVYLLIPYTVTMAVFWSIWVALTVTIGLPASRT